MFCFYLALLVLSLNAIEASVYSSIKNNILSLLDARRDEESTYESGPVTQSQKKDWDKSDRISAQDKAKILQELRKQKPDLRHGREVSSKLSESKIQKLGLQYFHMDPVLNDIRRRRKEARKKGDDTSDVDLKFWMDEWDEYWMQKKFEALNSSHPRGDVVNMVAARPWGVPCGDPNQHDMPWGSCMLPAECDAEYRIYRGDSFCGRTAYICCALLLTNYDMYQGLDISFEGSSFATDSNEKNRQISSKQTDSIKRKDNKNKRKKEREKRKRKIKKTIKKIVQEIERILNRAYRNGTNQRKKKTKELKKFIEVMKKQYKKDRKSVVNVHEHEMVKIDEHLQAKLDQIKGVNEAFMGNETFRDIVINGTVNKEKFMRLLRMHPELKNLIKGRRRLKKPGSRRRTGNNLKPGLDIAPESENEDPNAVEYDLEYGMVYF